MGMILDSLGRRLDPGPEPPAVEQPCQHSCVLPARPLQTASVQNREITPLCPSCRVKDDP